MNRAFTLFVGRSTLVTKRYMPEILLGLGMVGGVVTVVLACDATLKAQPVLALAKERLATIKEAEKFPKEYSLEDRRKDLTVTYSKASFELVKLYGPAFTLGVASGICILASRNILNKRNVALVAAYKAVEKSFSDYRHRVVDQLGEDREREIQYSVKKETLVTEATDPETGKVKKKKEVVDVFDPNTVSKYARFFDETCPAWEPNANYNRMFLQNQQRFATDKLLARGHLFLNEVYEALGFEHTKEGSVVGWIVRTDGSTDNFVDFGIFEGKRPSNREFVNGLESAILLDFNVDGVIFDLI
jgi:hypothetical protein